MQQDQALSSTKASSLVLLTGATGYVGGRLLRAIEAHGHRVRCMARRPEFLRPHTVFGDIGALSVRGRDRTWQEWLFLIAGLAMTMLLAYYLRRFAQKALAQDGEERSADPE